MAVKAAYEVTITDNTDIDSLVTWYYLTTSATKPAAPTTTQTSAAVPSPWTQNEPTFTAGTVTNYLYFCIQTRWKDGSCTWGTVQLSSAYEQSKQAWNKANAAQESVDNLEVGGRNLALESLGEYTLTKSSDSASMIGGRHPISDYGKEVCVAGATVLVSFEAKVSSGTHPVRPYLTDSSMATANAAIDACNATTEWQRFTRELTLTGNAVNWQVTGNTSTGSSGLTYYVRNVKVETGNKATDWTPAPEDLATTGDVAATQPLVIGTQTAATRFWTGNCPEVSSLAQGQHITYFLPYAYKKETAQSKGITASELVPTETVTTEYSNDWLKLTLSDGSDTGWVPVYYQGTTRLTSHYGAGMVIPLVYREGYSSSIPRGWWGASQYYVNNIDRTQHSNTCKATATNYKTINNVNYGIIASSIIGYVSDGYKTLAAGDSIDLASPILWATGNVNTSATFTNAYEVYPSCTLRNNVASWSGTTYAMAYLKGTVSGNTFTLDSTTPITSSKPQTEDGKIYIPIGQLYSAYQIAFRTSKELYCYKDGAFGPISIREASAIRSGANSRAQLVYYRTETEKGSSFAGPTTWVTTATDVYNAWTTKVPPLSASTDEDAVKYPYLYVAMQRQTMAQNAAGTTCLCSTPLLDDTITTVDGDMLITGSVTASKLDTIDLNASHAITIGAFDYDTSNTINGAATNATQALQDASDAAKTATNFITESDENDMLLTAGPQAYRVRLTSAGMEILNPDGDVVGFHGATIQLGSTDGIYFEASETRLAFRTLTQEIAYFGLNSDGIWQMHIATTYVDDMIRFGDYAWIKRDNGNMSIKWLGE